MGVLNFCEPCGALRVREVKDQLEKLFTVKSKPRPNRCGLCKTALDRKVRSLKLKVNTKATKRIKAKPGKSGNHGSIKIKVERRETRLETGSIQPVHFEGLESGDENDSIDIPLDFTNVSSGDSDSGPDDIKPRKLRPAAKVKVEVTKGAAAASKTQKKGTVKKKKKADHHEKILTDAELATRRAFDERVLAMVDTDGPRTKSLVCKDCKKTFCHIQKFVKHIGTHLEEKLDIDLPYICPTCNVRVANFLSLDRHMILHKEEKPYACKWPDCKASFACKRYLTKHVRRHEGHKSYYRRPVNKVRKFKCPQCDYMAISRDTLSFHENTHTQARPFKCEFCDRAFNNPRNRTIHERNMHSKSKDNHFMCELCGYHSFFKADLLKHQRIHTGDKPYACDICDYRSSRRNNLRKHIRIHTGEKKHKCHYCDKVFHTQQTCKEHEMNVHVNAQPFPISVHQAKESSMAFQSPLVDNTGTVHQTKESSMAFQSPLVDNAVHQAKESSVPFQLVDKEHRKDAHTNPQPIAVPQPQPTKESLMASFQSQQTSKGKDIHVDAHMNPQTIAVPQLQPSKESPLTSFHSQQTSKGKDIHVIPPSMNEVKEHSSMEGPSISSASNPKVPQIIPNPHHAQDLNPPPLMLMNNPTIQESAAAGQPPQRERVNFDPSKMEGLVGTFRGLPHHQQQQQPPAPSLGPPGPGPGPHKPDRSQSDWIRTVSFLQHLHQM